MHRVRMFWQVILASWKIGLLVAILFCGAVAHALKDDVQRLISCQGDGRGKAKEIMAFFEGV